MTPYETVNQDEMANKKKVQYDQGQSSAYCKTVGKMVNTLFSDV
jgi:hypothetical protein